MIKSGFGVSESYWVISLWSVLWSWSHWHEMFK